MRWAEISIAATGDEAQESVGALLTEVAGCQGYTATSAAVTGYLPVDERMENTLLSLRGALDGRFPMGTPEITVRFVAEEDWADAWKQYFKPRRVAERIVIKPTWEPYDAKADDLVIEIDPGMAFGTGLHATTRLCLQALERHLKPGDRVADVGTGSGILAIGAALLGAAYVDAVDIDPLAVRIAHENVAVNHVGDRVNVAVSSAPPPHGPFEIVVANILADVILNMAGALHAATAPGGLLIASGIIDSRADDVRRGLSALGFEAVEKRTEEEWVALVLRR